MSDLEAAIAAEMKRQGCYEVEMRQGFPTPDIWLACSFHNLPWDHARGECAVVAAAVRAGWDAAINAAAEVARLRGEVQRLESSKLLAASMMAESYCEDEIDRLREQVKTLQTERDAMTEIYAIETWIDAEAWSSGWGDTDAITTGKHGALARLRYLHQTHPDQEFRLVEAKRTSWLPVTEEGSTP